MIPLNKIIHSDCLEGLKTLPDNCVDCCVTSPPYFGLRNYNVEGQIGLEETPESFIAKMVEVFNEVKRVLKPTGVLWLNLGDSYAGSGRGMNGDGTSGNCGGKQATNAGSVLDLHDKLVENGAIGRQWVKPPRGYKPKDLIGIPWMVAFALRSSTRICQSCGEENNDINWGKVRQINGQIRMVCPNCLSILWPFQTRISEHGYYLRQDIIWAKPNPMPESVTDRCTKSHEYIFLLSKSAKYYFDFEAIQEPSVEANWQARKDRVKETHKSNPTEKVNGIRATKSTFGNRNGELNGLHSGKPFNQKYKNLEEKGQQPNTLHLRRAEGEADEQYPIRNKRSVWTVSAKPFKEAHFATFPQDLIIDCIKAGSSERCCSNCGNPYERVSNRELVPTKKASFNSVADKRDFEADKNDQGSNRMKDGHKPGWAYKSETIGWKPTCKCEAKVVPSIILDPFMGAGTTALVARKLNRNFIGFELNEKYIKIAEKRLEKELGMFQ